MTDAPKSQPPAPRRGRPTVANADIPSDTVGLPGVGDGASAAHFARDMVQGQAGDDDRTDSHVPPLPRDAES